MRKILPLGVLAAATIGLAALFWSVAERGETLREWLSFGSWNRFDGMIARVAERQGAPPELVKAVIWRESRFDPSKIGQQGERGLMQVTEGAAAEWAKAARAETFVPTDLLDPKTNIEAGVWYLARALRHWADRDNPAPFALAEYNAGRSRVRRWAADDPRSAALHSEAMLAAVDFPSTRAYINAILRRADFYRQRGDFAKVNDSD